MKREQSGPFLSAVFVDYDNIYMSLRRKSEDAAKRFAKDAMGWLKQIESGALITPTNGLQPRSQRRIVMNRCYGNPVPRRNASDNSTDMSSFPFIRHHFLRAGFEVVDCPPLTAQLKNSSDIRMVMDLRDYLDHDTHFDEFVILSGDADFTPVLHRLRAHARRTVIYATDYTAAPYTAISDGEVREADLISLLIEGRIGSDEPAAELPAQSSPQIAGQQTGLEATRRAILDEVGAAVRLAASPVPLEVLADRAVRNIGHDRTIGTGWAGAGGFRELLSQGLPAGLRLSGEPPYVVIDTSRHLAPSAAPHRSAREALTAALELAEQPMARALHAEPAPQPKSAPATSQSVMPAFAPQTRRMATEQPIAPAHDTRIEQPIAREMRDSREPREALVPQQQAPITSAPVVGIQQSIARIHEACKAPPLSPPEYRLLFEVIAQEITENGLIGAQTIQNINQRAAERGIDIRRDDVRFVLEVVSEADPWFEQGASPNLFAGRFRNFVVARCRAQGLTLSADELDLIEAWFAGGTVPTAAIRQPPPVPTFAAAPPARQAAPQLRDAEQGYWSQIEDARQQLAESRPRASITRQQAEPSDTGGDDFPRIVRTRIRS